MQVVCVYKKMKICNFLTYYSNSILTPCLLPYKQSIAKIFLLPHTSLTALISLQAFTSQYQLQNPNSPFRQMNITEKQVHDSIWVRGISFRITVLLLNDVSIKHPVLPMPIVTSSTTINPLFRLIPLGPSFIIFLKKAQDACRITLSIFLLWMMWFITCSMWGFCFISSKRLYKDWVTLRASCSSAWHCQQWIRCSSTLVRSESFKSPIVYNDNSYCILHNPSWHHKILYTLLVANQFPRIGVASRHSLLDRFNCYPELPDDILIRTTAVVTQKDHLAIEA